MISSFCVFQYWIVTI
uniref:Uncharacterized protein n=1 Tax=Arundo donax TaxID=35708 RepID=A0A0A9AXG4_ARUDO